MSEAYSSKTLKNSALVFMVGKVVSSLLTISILLWLVRLLSLEEYGAYVTLVAGLEMTLSLSSFGIPWIASRYLPEFHLYSNRNQLSIFIWQVLGLISLLSLVSSLLLYLAIPKLLNLIDMAKLVDSARLYLLVALGEIVRRNLQECILEPLLQQSYAQLSQIFRSLFIILFLATLIFLQKTQIYLNHIIAAEFFGTISGLITAVFGLSRFFKKAQHNPTASDWQKPAWKHMWHTGFYMYLNHIMSLIYSRQAYTFLIQRFLGLEATALFGFFGGLYGQISRYLPSTLLFSLIRPKLIASYLNEGGIKQLSFNANLAGKLSLFILMPILILTWLAGSEIVQLLSGGKFTATGLYFSCFLLPLIPLSQRQILETVAVACDKSKLCYLGSILGFLALPLAYILLKLDYGFWGIIIAMLAGEMLYNIVLNTNLLFFTGYQPNLRGVLKLLLISLLAYLLVQMLKMTWLIISTLSIESLISWHRIKELIEPTILIEMFTQSIHGWAYTSIIAIITGIVYLLVAYFIKPFHSQESNKINRILNRNIFIW